MYWNPLWDPQSMEHPWWIYKFLLRCRLYAASHTGSDGSYPTRWRLDRQNADARSNAVDPAGPAPLDVPLLGAKWSLPDGLY